MRLLRRLLGRPTATAGPDRGAQLREYAAALDALVAALEAVDEPRAAQPFRQRAGEVRALDHDAARAEVIDVASQLPPGPAWFNARAVDAMGMDPTPAQRRAFERFARVREAATALRVVGQR